MNTRIVLFHVLLLVLAPLAAAQGGGDEQEKSPEVLAQEKLAALQGLVNQGNEAFRVQDFAQAESLYSQALSSVSPALSKEQKLVVHGNRANACYRLERWMEAIESYRRSSLEDSIQWIAQCHIQLGNLQEGAFALQTALVLFPERTSLKKQLAQIAAMRGQDQLALSLFEELLAANPEDPSLWRSIASQHLALGNNDRALDGLEMSWRLGGRRPATARLLADLYMGEGMFLEAAGYYRKHLAMSESPSAEDHFRIGYAYYQSAERVSARSFFQLAVKSDGSYANAFLYLGHLALAEGDDESALTEFGRSLKMDPTLVVAHEAIGGIQMRRGKMAQAEESFRRALELPGVGFATHYNLIQIYIQRGARAEALSALRTAFHQYPERSELRAALNVIKETAGGK